MKVKGIYDEPRYELYFRSGGFDSITSHRFLDLLTAKDYCKKLNNELKKKGYNDRKYIIVKITRELIEE